MSFVPLAPANAALNGVQIGGTAAAGSLPAASSGAAGAWSAAPASFTPANPATTASLTLVMMGLGSTVTYTPKASGVVLVMATAVVFTATAAVSMTCGGRYGTGAAPANGAAVTGTRFGAAADSTLEGTSVTAGEAFALAAVLALVPGTAYWFDFALDTSVAADVATMVNPAFSIAEI
jgi:hypothetical protein